MQLRLATFLLTSLFVSFVGFSQTFIEGDINYQVISAGNMTVKVIKKTPPYSGDISIPATVTHDDNTYTVVCVGKDAFFNCVDLESIVIPEGITILEVNAFRACSKLSSINLPSTVTETENYAFYQSGLSTAHIPSTLTTYGFGGFGSCPNLISITVDESHPNLSARDGVLFNKAGTSLTQFPAGQGTSYTVPEKVKAISGFAFANSIKLEEITLPGKLSAINKNTFLNCTGLTKIISKVVVAPTCDVNGFAGVLTQNVTLVVPIGSKSSYEAAEVWSNFNIEEANLSSVNPVFESKIKIWTENKNVIVSLSDELFGERITIYNSLGQKVYNNNVLGTTICSIPSGEGVYFVRFEGARLVRKVMVY